MKGPWMGDENAYRYKYNGIEEVDDFGLDLSFATFRTLDPSIGRWLQVDPYANSFANFSPYNSMGNNPVSFTDPNGDFITWGIGNGGLSIGFNLSPIGIPVGGGINIGWSGGGSAGIYGEVGYRTGGTGLGAGATASQSLGYNFRNNSWTTSTSAGVYGSLGPASAGANIGTSGWGVNVGLGIGDEGAGVGLSLGYGSAGLTYGVGGFYDPSAWEDVVTYSLPDGDLPIHEQADKTVGCTQEVCESINEYNGGEDLNLNKDAGADFRVTGEGLGWDVSRSHPNPHIVGREMLNGNPSAVTYDNNGTQHTVGINKISYQKRSKLFGGGDRHRTKIQVMNPLYSKYKTLPIRNFNNGIIRTVTF